MVGWKQKLGVESGEWRVESGLPAKALLCLLIFNFQFSIFNFSFAQEVLLPLRSAPALTAPKASAGAVALPFFDDFAGTEGLPSGARWQTDGGAAVSYGARLRPPTVGVATLDALDASGRLYQQATQSAFAADTLTSLPIRLDSCRVADSVVLSFFYLPGGGEGNLWERVGDGPDAGDSLFLDFYRPADSAWVTVWGRGGVSVDSLVAATGRAWQYVAVAVGDEAYLDSAFRFRFRNLCSLPSSSKPGLAGNCDYWHLDYIQMDRHRTTTAGPLARDVAFVDPAPSLLAHYRAMPARQYLPQEMASSLQITITNLFDSPLASQYGYAVVDEGGDTLYRYDGGYENAPPDGYQTAPAHAEPPVQYAFPAMGGTTRYDIVHTVREGVGGDEHRANDTVRFRQVFDNYYAYDDGTAENGYGITSTASRIYLAYRFDLNAEDTLTAVDLCFNRTYNDEAAQVPFRLTVWSNEEGRPGAVLYSDTESRVPAYRGANGFCRYRLERALALAGSVFVGLEQQNNYYINLGFDRSLNTSDRIFYLTGTEWQQSILSGSLMMRPCFGSEALVGIDDHVGGRRYEVRVYPNPARDYVTIEGLPEGSRIMVYDLTGRLLLSTLHAPLSTQSLPRGMVFLRCITPQGGVHTEKLIINK